MLSELRYFFCDANVFVRRLVLEPPFTDFTAYCHSTLSIASVNTNPVLSVTVDGSYPAFLKSRRLYRIPELGPTSSVRVHVVERCVAYLRVYIPKDPKTPFEDPDYHFLASQMVEIYRSPTELMEYVRTLTKLTLDLRVVSDPSFHTVKDVLVRSGRLRSLAVCFSFSCLEADARSEDSLWVEAQNILLSISGVEELDVTNLKHYYPSLVFEFFQNMPRKLTLRGRMDLFGFERLSNVEELTISGTELGPDLPSNFAQFIPNLKSLSMHDVNLTFPLSELRVRDLALSRMDLTYTDCVNIGRLLRRNQLDRLSVSNCPGLLKQTWRPILLPLVDGSNRSLVELVLRGNNLSTNTYYMLEDIVKFCPTLQRLTVPIPPFLQDMISNRESYALTVGNVRIALKSVPDGSALARALTVFVHHCVCYVPVYRRRNRVWRQTGTRKLVSDLMYVYND